MSDIDHDQTLRSGGEKAPDPALARTQLPGNRDPDDLVGQVLGGRYRLDTIVGSGGAGNVYSAEHTTIHKRVAVKVLKTEFLTKHGQKARFLREARAASRLSHDNVIEVIDFGDAPNGSVFIVMEWLDGEDLGETIDREAPFSWKRSKQIILQICRAVHAAHSNGVLHRDIKPQNCYRIKRRSNTDFIKVLDFGLAKVFGNESDPKDALTKTGSVFGTPEYMAPEQARGRKPDDRTDVYSIGVVLYEMLSGTVPFGGTDLVGVLVKHVAEPVPPPSTVAPDAGITPEMDAVVLKALEKDPADRHASVKDFAEAVADVPIKITTAYPAEEGPEITRLQASVRSLRLMVALMSAAILVLAVLLAVSLAK